MHRMRESCPAQFCKNRTIVAPPRELAHMGNHAGSHANGESSSVGYSIYRSWMVAATNCGRVGDQSRNGAQVSAPGIPGHFRPPDSEEGADRKPVISIAGVGLPSWLCSKGFGSNFRLQSNRRLINAAPLTSSRGGRIWGPGS
jgi:hypothetical protein